LNLPVLRFFARPSIAELALPALEPPAPPPPPCLLEPLSQIDDTDALEFEAASGTSAVVDVEGLTPAMSAALHRFVQTVASVGGEMELKSAYRPPAYQAHLQDVWDKWMTVRSNRDPNCTEVRAGMQMEFERHRLLESQRPVTFSDHTRGNAFDATVFLPAGAKLARRRVTLDKLARLSGVQRPDIARDPVHFRLIGAPSPRS
jgi:D-alanyl-D-alanine dipeptidase